MGVFGGDPRFIYLEILLRFNVIYDIVLLPLVIGLHLIRESGLNELILILIFTIFEAIRMLCCNSHIKGDIPLYVAFLLLTVLPTFVVGLIWAILRPGGTDFDTVCVIGIIVQHILEIAFCWKVYKSFKHYQDGFYQFSQGIGRPPEEYPELLSDPE
jgi:hypothetical protein